MKSFISEDNIEQSICGRLSLPEYGWQRIACDPGVAAQDDVSRTGRANAAECVLPEVLRTALKRINPQVDDETLENIARDLSRDYTATDMIETNYRLYNQIRNGIKVSVKRNGREDFDIVRLMDFDNVEKNLFHCVNQMWIKGRFRYRRPDVLLFVNGLPVVFIELKNSTVKVEESYNKNLVSYRKDIPNIFAWNQICVLSNGMQTKIGAWNSGYEFFFEWLRVDDERERLNREKIAEYGLSITHLIDGLLRKERLLDYIENFIFFDNKRVKIIAKNHQYLGVNHLMASMERRSELRGKLGVFWHTQGSGKSYSMVMFVRKVRRKLHGNYSFLVVTDREDLDTQLHKTFVRSEVIGAQEECQPRNAEQLREFLRGNKPMVFTLIQKFQYDKAQRYPLLTERDDLIVLVDEAHRTQYKQLAENMHNGLPNANYIAFTGTPLLGAKRLTNQWFGDYVSEYNFAQSIDDGSTVPLFYSRRVPEVGLENNWLDTDLDKIVEEESLNERETALLENSGAQILEVVRRDERLNRVAQDIAHHFPRRGFRGKGMVMSVDKYTTVKMYNKVQHYWAEEKKALVKERNNADTAEKRDELNACIDYMNRAEMAVVVSEEADETEKFAAMGLDIAIHRSKMNAISPEGKDIEDRFKDKDDPLCLVFVCAMWLTGFDVPSLSTLYLDKPMKGHTLMQAIARANRVFPGKSCGLVVDYVNVFKYMRQALSDYASTGDTEYPIKDMAQLIGTIDYTIAECDKFLQQVGISLDDIIGEEEPLEQLNLLCQAYDRLLKKEEWKEHFRVMTNLLKSQYEAAKPEIIEQGWHNEKYAPIDYLNGLFCNRISNEKLSRAKAKMAYTLDDSVTAAAAEEEVQYGIRQGRVIDLSKLDIDSVRKELKSTPYKAIAIESLRELIEQTLNRLINANCTRVKFSQRYRDIIDRYNAGAGDDEEDYYEQLLQLIADLNKEQSRSTEMGLSEEELEIYDLLSQNMGLTEEEGQQVIAAAKNLHSTLHEKKEQLMVVDWHRYEKQKEKVFEAIRQSLDNDLPASYGRDAFNSKSRLLLTHLADMTAQGLAYTATNDQ